MSECLFSRGTVDTERCKLQAWPSVVCPTLHSCAGSPDRRARTPAAQSRLCTRPYVCLFCTLNGFTSPHSTQTHSTQTHIF